MMRVRGGHPAILVTVLLCGLCGCVAPSSKDLKKNVTPVVLHTAQLRFEGVPAPSGFTAFCERFAEQCESEEGSDGRAVLTQESLEMLRLVNVAINRSIRSQEDRAHYGIEEFWTIPIDGYGDCDDYVMVKRKALGVLGFPSSSLRIAEVLAPRFMRHVVLIVRTDKGNYVLDNLQDAVTEWDRTTYGWIKWQDPKSATGWASLK